MPWVASPSAGVWRKRLELYGPPEAGRVTSVVRYDPGSRFPLHPHPEGEEILVLDGVFSDSTGSYSAGAFLLNPEGFEHAPWSEVGCTLLVKLRQSPGAVQRVAVDTRRASWQERGGKVESISLYESEERSQSIRLTRLLPGCDPGLVALPGGEEIFVVDGSFEDEYGHHSSGTWLRFPRGNAHSPRSPGGCTLYVKSGHLPDSAGPP